MLIITYFIIINLQFLWTTVGLTIDEFRAKDNEALRQAVVHADVDVLEFLWTVVKLTKDDFSVNDKAAKYFVKLSE